MVQVKLDALETAWDSANKKSQLAPEIDTNHKVQNFLKSQVVNNEPLLEKAAGPSLTGSDVLFEDQTLTKEVKTSQLPLNPDTPQFLPHHGVYYPRKPGKLRVVFDGSARYMSLSLNELLLQGPDFINSLCGVLCQFRKEPVVFVCDIELMFLQFRVETSHQDYFRFLWWKKWHCGQRGMHIPHDKTPVWCSVVSWLCKFCT